MRKEAVRSKGIAALSIVVIGTACCGAALAKPIPPACDDSRVAANGSVSQVPTALIADDFEPRLSVKISRLDTISVQQAARRDHS